MATEIWVNIGLGNGFLPDGTKPLPEPILTYYQWSRIHLRAILQEVLKISVLDMSLKIADLRLKPHLLGANELRWSIYWKEPLKNVLLLYFLGIHGGRCVSCGWGVARCIAQPLRVAVRPEISFWLPRLHQDHIVSHFWSCRQVRILLHIAHYDIIPLTHWGRVTHNGLLPILHQAII